MKSLKKWSRILHRDIGFFFVGASIIYGLSGIALNHIKDWNPNYSVDLTKFKTTEDLSKNNVTKEKVINFLNKQNINKNFKNYYFPEKNKIKIFLDGGSSVVVNTKTGEGKAEIISKRLIFYDVNFLHYNPQKWWTIFSDTFAGALIFLAISSLFMIKGKKGVWGTGGIYVILGIIIPILFLIFLQ